MAPVPRGYTQSEIKVGAQDVHPWIQEMGWEVPGVGRNTRRSMSSTVAPGSSSS
jgi:hypothetical protein